MIILPFLRSSRSTSIPLGPREPTLDLGIGLALAKVEELFYSYRFLVLSVLGIKGGAPVLDKPKIFFFYCPI